MQFLDFLASAFINTFGITQPTEKTRRHASYFILSLLVLTGVVMIVAAVTYFRVLRS
ncbi:hypothetical protein ACFQBQ_14885 [Granulicella cerasi]|uniref:Uncharacterized protein n=1 Tax=Granulicella cerasi TaxID=741063 RepID=A0ABW1ZBQ5_9BACT|nr:hypothetical protein [Granulicella cerasi]